MISYVILIATLKEEKRMKSLKQWFMLLLASLMILGVATGCSDDATNEEDTNTEETENEETEDTNTEDAEQTEDTEEEGQ